MSAENLHSRRTLSITTRVVLVILLLIMALVIPEAYNRTQNLQLASDINRGSQYQLRDQNITNLMYQVQQEMVNLFQSQSVDGLLVSWREKSPQTLDYNKNLTKINSLLGLLSQKITQRDNEGYNLNQYKTSINLLNSSAINILFDNVKNEMKFGLPPIFSTLSTDQINYYNNLNNFADTVANLTGFYRQGSSLSQTGTFANVTIKLSEITTSLHTLFQTANATNNSTLLKYAYSVLKVADNVKTNLNELYSFLVQFNAVMFTEKISVIQREASRFRQKIDLFQLSANSSLQQVLNPNSVGYIKLQSNESKLFKDLYNISFNSTNAIYPTTKKSLQFLDIVSTSIQSLIDTSTLVVPAKISQIISDFSTLIAIVSAQSQNFRILLTGYIQQRLNQIFLVRLILVSLIGLLIFLFVVPLLINLRRLTIQLDKGFSKIIERDLSIKKFKHISAGEIGRIQIGFNSVVESLQFLIAKLAESSETLSSISETMASSSEEASASISQVSDTISSIAYGASEQNRLIAEVSDKLKGHLKEVTDATSRIADTSIFVQKVAKRTNILGLNASIEAAKAGDFGRGFSIVAENVREFSDDTKNYANQISGLIDEISFKISRTIDNVIHEVSDIRDISETTASNTQEANAATTEQVSMLHEISYQAAEIATVASELNTILSEFNIEK